MLRLVAAALLASTALAGAATVDAPPAAGALPDCGACDALMDVREDRTEGSGVGGLIQLGGPRHEDPAELAFTGTREVAGVFFFDYAEAAAPSSRLTRAAAVFELPPSLPTSLSGAATMSLASAAAAPSPVPSPVPVPAAGLLLLGALGALGAARRRG